MKKLFPLLIIILSVNLYAQSDITEIKDFGSNPGNLKMFFHAPDSAKGKAKLPLVIALHGCTQNAKMIADQTGWNKLADKYGFYVLYPQQRILNNPSDCFVWFEENNVTKDKGEAGSIKQMIDYALSKYSIDTTQIFVYGLSAGAAMTTALLADYPQLFNMGAILAGGPFVPDVGLLHSLSFMQNPKDYSAAELSAYVHSQNPGYKGKYPRILIMHGKNDEVVNEKNAFLIIKQWYPLLHTDSLPTRSVSPFQGKEDINRKSYCDSTGAEQMIFYEVNNLGHALMVAPGDSATQGGETGLFSIDKSFYSTYWIALDMGLIKQAH